MALEDVQQSWIRWAIDSYASQIDAYTKYENYYNSEHELAFATDKWIEIFGDEFEEAAFNFCQVVVDSPAQRLEILGWDSDDKSDEGKEAIKAAEDIWDDNELSGGDEDDLHTQAFVKGDGYLMVWPGNGGKDLDNPNIIYHDALDVNIFYNPANKRQALRATKKWEDESGQLHLYIYYEDHTEHYLVPNQLNAAMSAGLIAPEVGADSQLLPEGWVKAADSDIPNPWNRLPVFHFRNRSPGSTHGMSEIKPVIPAQNAFNKITMDMLIASEFGAFKQKWMAGSGHPAEGWKTGAGRIWATTDPSAKFGQFDADDLTMWGRVRAEIIGDIAKMTQTPLHYLRPSGDMPSGDALKTAESGLVEKIKDRQKRWGKPWSEAMTFAVSIKLRKDVKSAVYPRWRAAETRFELEQAQTVQLKSILGIPLEHLWSEHFGYSEEMIEEFKKQNKAIAASVLQQAIAQTGQLPPGMGDEDGAFGGLDLPQILALLPKGVTGTTTAGEATTKPQPNSRPPASPTRRSSGFKG